MDSLYCRLHVFKSPVECMLQKDHLLLRATVGGVQMPLNALPYRDAMPVRGHIILHRYRCIRVTTVLASLFA